MKKKLLSILVTLIVCISPLFFATGCTGGDTGVTFPDTIKTGWTFVVDDNFSACVSGMENRACPEGKIAYTATTRDEDYAKANEYTYNEKTFLWEKDNAEIDISDAVKERLLVCIGGFDTDTVTESGKPRTMTLMFDGATIEVEYTVVAKSE